MMKKIISAGIFIFMTPLLFATDFWQPLGGPSDNAVWGLTFQTTGTNLFASFPSEFEPDGPIRGSSVFRSGDQGASWTAMTNWPAAKRAIALFAAANGNLFAASHTNGVFRSQNDGLDWLPVTNGLAGVQVGCLGGNGAGKITQGSAPLPRLNPHGRFERTTTMTLDWIAERLHMGCRHTAANSLKG